MSKKQDKLIRNEAPRKFEIGDKLFAKYFHETEWIPVKVTKVTGHFQMRYKQTLALS